MLPVTIKQLAADLNLSVPAVSAALGAKSTSKVSKETAERVRAYAKKVNYRPSLAGKRLGSKHLCQVGFLVESDFDQSRRVYPVMDTPAIFGLNDFLTEREWQLNIIADSCRRSEEAPLPRYLRERFLDGLVVSSTTEIRNKTLDKDLVRFSIPAVFLNGIGKYNCVRIDERAGMFEVIRHLTGLGHKRILYVGSQSDHPSMAGRLTGYQEAMNLERVESSVYVLEMESPKELLPYEQRLALKYSAGSRFIENCFLRQRPTAIVCYDDGVAMILMKALHDAGFAVPKDVSVVGFNDAPFMDLLTTPLTTLNANFYKMGQLAGELLLDLIQNQKTRILSPAVKPELVLRQSTCSAAR